MIFGALIIDLLFIGLGALMRTTEYDPNPVFGYRTTRSLQSPEAWTYANRKSGSLMIVVGLMGLAVALITAALDAATPLSSTDAGKAAAACCSLGFPLVGILIATMLVERDLKRLFPDGKAKVPDNGSEAGAPSEAAQGESFLAPGGTAQGESLPNGTARSRIASLGTAQKVVFGALCVLPLIIAACGFFALPDTIAVHFDAAGADGWAPKAQLFAFAAIMAISNVAVFFAYRTFLSVQTQITTLSMRSAPFAVFSACMFVSSAAVLFVVLSNLA